MYKELNSTVKMRPQGTPEARQDSCIDAWWKPNPAFFCKVYYERFQGREPLAFCYIVYSSEHA